MSVSGLLVSAGAPGEQFVSHPLLRDGIVRTYIAEPAASVLIKEPINALLNAHMAALSQTFAITDQRPARLSSALQQAALLMVRSPPAAMFCNSFVSEAGSDDVGDLQSALQVVCRDGSIISFVFSMLHAAADLSSNGEPQPPTRAAFGDLQRVYIDSNTSTGLRLRSRHFPLLSVGSAAVHCSSHLLVMASEGARVFCAAHCGRDKAKRSFFNELPSDIPDIAEASSSDQIAASAPADKPHPLGGTANSAWASVDAPDRAPIDLSVNSSQSAIVLTYKQRVALMDLRVSESTPAPSTNSVQTSRLNMQLQVSASLEIGNEWSIVHSEFINGAHLSSLISDDAMCLIQQRDAAELPAAVSHALSDKPASWCRPVDVLVHCFSGARQSFATAKSGAAQSGTSRLLAATKTMSTTTWPDQIFSASSAAMHLPAPRSANVPELGEFALRLHCSARICSVATHQSTPTEVLIAIACLDGSVSLIRANFSHSTIALVRSARLPFRAHKLSFHNDAGALLLAASIRGDLLVLDSALQSIPLLPSHNQYPDSVFSLAQSTQQVLNKIRRQSLWDIQTSTSAPSDACILPFSMLGCASASTPSSIDDHESPADGSALLVSAQWLQLPSPIRGVEGGHSVHSIALLWQSGQLLIVHASLGGVPDLRAGDVDELLEPKSTHIVPAASQFNNNQVLDSQSVRSRISGLGLFQGNTFARFSEGALTGGGAASHSPLQLARLIDSGSTVRFWLQRGSLVNAMLVCSCQSESSRPALSALVLNCVLASSDAQLKLSAPLVSAFVRSLWVSMEHSEGQSKQMAARTADRAQLYISHRIRLLAARFKQVHRADCAEACLMVIGVADLPTKQSFVLPNISFGSEPSGNDMSSSGFDAARAKLLSDICEIRAF